MKKPMKKLLVILLALFLVVSNTLSIFAEGDDAYEGEDGSGSVTEVYDYDASELHVSKLGKADKEEDIVYKKHSDERKRSAASKTVRVSIVLEDPSTLSLFDAETVAKDPDAIAYREELLSEQEKMTEKIEDELGKTLEVEWNLTLAANIISVNLSEDDIEQVEKLDGVKSVEVETLYRPLDDDAVDPNTAFTTEYMVGATTAWADGYTGVGSKVAIIDTGTNQDHISFAGDGLLYSLEKGGYDESVLMTADDVEAVKDQLNVAIDPQLTYKSYKIPYAYNYVDDNYKTDHKDDDEGEHGSHVSGIAAANRYVKVGGEFVEAVTSDVVYAVGVAPDAQIITMKVFGAGGGAYDSDYMAAIEDAIVLGADSINLSLGSGSAGFAMAGTYQEIMDSLPASVSVVAISAGNAGAWTDHLDEHYNLYAEDVNLDTGGSPGSFVNSLTVASADNVGTSGMPLYFNGTQQVFYNESTTNGAWMAGMGGDYDYVYIDNVGDGDDYAAVNEVVSLAGKVVIVNRGDISFFVKGNNAIPYAPAILIVADNVEESLGGMQLDDYEGSFPMLFITLADAETIKENSTSAEADGYTYYTGTVKAVSVIESELVGTREDAVISDFSSWGTSGALLLKPEITAPGGNIWSVNGLSDEYYESMSGTSMAAPHITGMAGVLGQYLRDGDEGETIFDLAKEASGKDLKQRNLINSLLMSTATPMKNNGEYVSLLQQGAGLADVGKAVRANAFILMGDDATASAADGKVKAEFGQDAKREGVYTYTFTANNISDEDIVYELDTDLFTQTISNGEMLQSTRELDGDVEYEFELPPLLGHDVNKDGTTDYADVQAILDYLTGIEDGEDYDLPAGEMDNDDSLTTYDAYLLGLWIKDEIGVEEGQLLVPAHKNSKVTVTITLSDSEKETLDEENAGGAYVEGFTILSPVATEEGVLLDVEHSIPLFGFYGSWTDASMFDSFSLIDGYYGSEKEPYMGDYETNYMTVKYPGSTVASEYTGNPYLIENEFPSDRLALSNGTTVSKFYYTLIRSAGTAGWVAIKEDGTVVGNGNLKEQVEGPWYYSSGSSWQNAKTKKESVNAKVSEFGLEEGDRFTLGYFAIPEYYSLMLENGSEKGSVSADEIGKLLAEGELGEGAYIGYTFTVDNTAPEFDEDNFILEDGVLTFTVTDNQYISMLAILSADGEYLYDYADPLDIGQSEAGEKITYQFDVSEYDDVAIAVFAADYAGNEKAVLVKINEGTMTVPKAVYKLTDKLSNGDEYVIASTDKAGDAYALYSQGSGNYSIEAPSLVNEDEENGIYIDSDYVYDEMVWTAYDYNSLGYILVNKADGGYLQALGDGYRPASYNGSLWTYGEGGLVASNGLYITYLPDYETFLTLSGENVELYGGLPVYIYVKDYIQVEYNPDVASAVTITPASDTLILNVKESTDLYASVSPITLDDRTVTWASEDEDVATVDQNGTVKAVGTGSTTIFAFSNKTPAVYGTATINVVDSNPMDAYVYAQVAGKDAESGEETVNFVKIDLNDMSIDPIAEAESVFVGGGQSGNYIYGNDADNIFDRYEITDSGIELDEDFEFEINPNYALIDAVNVPDYVYGTEEGEVFHCTVGGFTESGLMLLFFEDGSLNSWNLTSLANFVAGTYAGVYEEDGDEYYLIYALTDDGALFVLYILVDEAGATHLYYDVLGQINRLTMSDDATAYSMTHAGSMTSVDSVFIADNTSKAIYYVDLSSYEGEETEFDATFVGRLPSATNLSTLFNNDFDSAKEQDSDAWTNGTVSKNASLKPLDDQKIDLTGDKGEAAEETANNDETDEATDKVQTVASAPTKATTAGFGSLNSVKDYVPSLVKKASAPVGSVLKKVSSEVAASGDVTITISEEATATNGLYTITYDPDKVAYKDDSEDARFISIAIDQENGEIRFAFVDLDGIEAGKVITTIEFEALCEDSEIVTETKERNNALDLSEKINTPVEGIGHAWGEPQWQWSNGNTEATATFTCGNDPDHQEVVPATVTKTEQLPTETEDGWRTFTATVTLEGNTYTATKTIKLDKHGKIPVPDTGRK